MSCAVKSSEFIHREGERHANLGFQRRSRPSSHHTSLPGSVCHMGDEQDMGTGIQTDPEGIKCIACSLLSGQRSSAAHHSEQVSRFL